MVSAVTVLTPKLDFPSRARNSSPETERVFINHIIVRRWFSSYLIHVFSCFSHFSLFHPFTFLFFKYEAHIPTCCKLHDQSNLEMYIYIRRDLLVRLGSKVPKHCCSCSCRKWHVHKGDFASNRSPFHFPFHG